MNLELMFSCEKADEIIDWFVNQFEINTDTVANKLMEIVTKNACSLQDVHASFIEMTKHGTSPKPDFETVINALADMSNHGVRGHQAGYQLQVFLRVQKMINKDKPRTTVVIDGQQCGYDVELQDGIITADIHKIHIGTNFFGHKVTHKEVMARKTFGKFWIFPALTAPKYWDQAKAWAQYELNMLKKYNT